MYCGQHTDRSSSPKCHNHAPEKDTNRLTIRGAIREKRLFFFSITMNIHNIHLNNWRQERGALTKGIVQGVSFLKIDFSKTNWWNWKYKVISFSCWKENTQMELVSEEWTIPGTKIKKEIEWHSSLEPQLISFHLKKKKPPLTHSSIICSCMCLYETLASPKPILNFEKWIQHTKNTEHMCLPQTEFGYNSLTLTGCFFLHVKVPPRSWSSLLLQCAPFMCIFSTIKLANTWSRLTKRPEIEMCHLYFFPCLSLSLQYLMPNKDDSKTQWEQKTGDEYFAPQFC